MSKIAKIKRNARINAMNAPPIPPAIKSSGFIVAACKNIFTMLPPFSFIVESVYKFTSLTFSKIKKFPGAKAILLQ